MLADSVARISLFVFHKSYPSLLKTEDTEMIHILRSSVACIILLLGILQQKEARPSVGTFIPGAGYLMPEISRRSNFL